MRALYVRWQTRRAVRRDLRRLANLGLVERVGSGWDLTAFGRLLADAQRNPHG